jgi:hypothetical protein
MVGKDRIRISSENVCKILSTYKLSVTILQIPVKHSSVVNMKYNFGEDV